MGNRRGGCLTGLLLALSLALVAAGAGAVYLVATGQGPFAPAEGGAAGEELEPASFAEYDWDELAEVAGMIADAPSDEEGASVAEKWGVEVGDTRPLPLSDGRQAQLTVAGIRCDACADGSGVAGLTLMASPIAVRAMGDSSAGEGSWETSSLRRWLAEEGSALLPDELVAHLVPVTKTSSDMGLTGDPAAFSTTDDALWLFSVSEVCGPVDLFVTEYGEQIRARTSYIDYSRYDEALSGEGAQYPLFAQAGVTCTSDPSGLLALGYGGASTSWWYRSSYPASESDDGYFFYQVNGSGYPTTIGAAEQEAGVAVGLCL